MYQLQYHHLLQQMLLQRGVPFFKDSVAIFHKLFRFLLKLFCSGSVVKIIFHWVYFLKTTLLCQKYLIVSSALLNISYNTSQILLDKGSSPAEPSYGFFSFVSLNMYASTFQFNCSPQFFM